MLNRLFPHLEAEPKKHYLYLPVSVDIVNLNDVRCILPNGKRIWLKQEDLKETNFEEIEEPSAAFYDI